MTKTQARKKLTQGNHKLDKSIATWDLPASQEVCGRVCPGCYAKKAQQVYPAVLPSRERKLQLTKEPHFTEDISESIFALSPSYVRIHSSGEFYSQKYVNDWYLISRIHKDTTFYAYTKRKKDFDFSVLEGAPNVVIIDSLHSGTLNYGVIEDKPKGMFLCPDYPNSAERLALPKGAICGNTCHYCMSKDAQKTGVYFKIH